MSVAPIWGSTCCSQGFAWVSQSGKSDSSSNFSSAR